VRRIGGSIAALNRLFEKPLDISCLQAGTGEVRRRNMLAQPLFDQLREEFQAEADGKDLRLRFRPTPLAVDCDPTLLERVVSNLVSNAIRYALEGDVLIGARPCGKGVPLQVWDSGIGIPLEQRSMTFEEFYQVDNPGRDRRKGLVLGLAIVQRLNTLLGTPLHFRSISGQGTFFALTSPMATGAPESITQDDERELRAGFEGLRALIIDDDVAICEATQRLLRKWVFKTRAALQFAEAGEVLDDGFLPDVILADLRLADEIDGIRAVGILHDRLRRNVPAPLISGETGASELARVKERGLVLLTKPVAPAELRSALHCPLPSQL
jgi:CheY-like chemotaxis protein